MASVSEVVSGFVKNIKAASDNLAKLEAEIKALDSKSASILAQTDAALKKVTTYKIKPIAYKDAGWLKKAQKLGLSDSAAEKALTDLEKKASRKELEAAIKIVGKNKKLDQITNSMKAFAKVDDEGESKIKAISAKNQSLLAAAKAVQTTVDDIVKRAAKLKG